MHVCVYTHGMQVKPNTNTHENVHLTGGGMEHGINTSYMYAVFH